MTRLDRIAALNAKIRNLILEQTIADDGGFRPCDPLNEMWLGVEKIAAGLAQAKTETPADRRAA